jgi:Calcium-binding EGF domain
LVWKLVKLQLEKLTFIFQDVDECLLGISNCTSNQTCTNTPGSYICNCSSGFSLQDDKCLGKHMFTSSVHVVKHTNLIDLFLEASLCSSNSDCGNNATCSSVLLGYQICECKSGFLGVYPFCLGLNLFSVFIFFILFCFFHL